MKKWQTCLLGVGSICCLAACSAKNMSDEATMKEQTKTEQVSAQTATKGQAVARFETDGSRWQDLPACLITRATKSLSQILGFLVFHLSS